MNVLNIIVAPKSKLALFYNPITKEIEHNVADIIGTVEFQDPDGSDLVANIACYLSYDGFGMYTVPQLQPNFIDMVEDASYDIDKYKEQIKGIEKFYKEMDDHMTGIEAIEVHRKGNVSFIKNLKRDPKKPEDE